MTKKSLHYIYKHTKTPAGELLLKNKIKLKANEVSALG